MAATDLFAERRRAVMLAAAERWRESPVTAASREITPAEQTKFELRRGCLAHAGALKRTGELSYFIERKIGPTLDWFSAPPSEAAKAAGRPVARIVSNPDPTVEAYGYATGFLISPNVLLTNWHVFPDQGAARGQGANFLHDQGEKGVARGVTFETDPDALFFSNEQLDFAIVALKPTSGTGESLSGLPFLSINGSSLKILPGLPIRIIEYPDGGAKRYATENCRLLELRDDGFMRYETDTDGGSSGSPCFSDIWEVCGLHHASIPKMRGASILNVDNSVWTPGDPEDHIAWVANEGIRISTIVKALGSVSVSNPVAQRLLHELMIGTSDPAQEIASRENAIAQESVHNAKIPDLTKRVAAMPDITMNFSGPVTIIIGNQDVPVARSLDVSTTGVSALEKYVQFDPDYDGRKGYNEAFLGKDAVVPLPDVSPARMPEMYSENGEVRILDYHHYSLAMNEARRLQIWSAANVDYDKAKRNLGSRKSLGQDHWIADPRIPAEIQITDKDIYGPASHCDRGHIVRREDSAWGKEGTKEEEFSNSDTFHWTNCTPQQSVFNQTGLWGGFEKFIEKDLQKVDTRACILAGPVLDPHDKSIDFGNGPVQYPTVFWKIVVVRSPGGDNQSNIQAFGFLLSQKDAIEQFGFEFDAGIYARYQVSLSTISDRTGVVFDKVLLDADMFGK